MKNFIEGFRRFMQGRYGTDTLNNFLAGLSVFIWIVDIFVFNWIARSVIALIQLGIIGFFIFRMLSRNINARSRENRAFLKVFTPVKNWVVLQYKKIRDRKTYRYLTCPHCKANLRVRYNKGRHTVHCPKCGKDFEKNIR